MLRKGLLALAGGIIVFLVGPMLIPIPPLKNTFPPQVLGDNDSQFIELDGFTYHVKMVGTGEPVFLLLHGFASSLYTWNTVMEPLSKTGTVIAYDRIGFGLSERPLTWKGQNPYSSAKQVELVVRLLDHYGIEKAILVGNSAGGTISMQVALEHPERVSALILVDPAVYKSGGVPGWIKPILATPQMRRLGPLFTRQILKLGPKLINLSWNNPLLISTETLDYYRKPYQVENWDKALWEFTLSSHPTSLPNRLKEIDLPVLVVTGDNDRIVPTKDSVRLAKELPNASLEVIPNAGHIPHEEKPEQFMDVVIHFISNLNP